MITCEELDGSVTQVSRNPDYFWYGVLRGSLKDRVSMDISDPVEEQLYKAGYKLGKKGLLKLEDSEEKAIAALVCKLQDQPFFWRGTLVGVLSILLYRLF